MSKRKKDMFGFVMENATISAGTMASAGLVGKIGTTLPSDLSGKIGQGMEPMAMIPTLHATGGVFGQLNNLNRMTRKRRK